MVGRGGRLDAPRLTRLLDFVAQNGNDRSKARQKSFRNYFGQFFFAQVNIEVTRGHQASKLAKIRYFFGNLPLSQKPFRLGDPGKKIISLGLFFRQHVITSELI